MIRKIFTFIIDRTFHWCGVYLCSALAAFLICRAFGYIPNDAALCVLLFPCALFFTIDLLVFVGKLTAKPQATQIGNKLFITKGSSIVATVILKDDRPLSDDEIAVIIEDVARFAAGER